MRAGKFILLGITSVFTAVTISSVVFAASATSIVNYFPGSSIDSNSPPSGVVAANNAELFQLTNTGYKFINLNKGKQFSGNTQTLLGVGNHFLSDPQVIWDNTTKRFYISMFENAGTSTPDEGIVWGFSKIKNPKKPSDFCTYFNGFNYGSTTFPDKQVLGDTSNVLLIGDNRYNTYSMGMVSSDLAWITKPPAGKTCPAASTFGSGVVTLKNPDGSNPFTPVPAQEVDRSNTGWVIATSAYDSASTLTEYSVNYDSAANSINVSQPMLVPVPQYSAPPYVPQAGQTLSGASTPKLETNVFLTQSIYAYDPSVGHDVLWTAHTIAGGAGAEVRWYEVNPANATLDSYGTISDPSLNVFNAAIAPDRLVAGRKKAYGNAAVISFNTSSPLTYPAIQMASIVNGVQQGSMTMVMQSAGPNVDFSCFEQSWSVCRWGDYPGAAPDPGAQLGATHGQVWLSNQWNMPDINDSTPTWQTSIWRVGIL